MCDEKSTQILFDLCVEKAAKHKYFEELDISQYSTIFIRNLINIDGRN
jgi:hypothetical protein